jgi:hypothetical protein
MPNSISSFKILIQFFCLIFLNNLFLIVTFFFLYLVLPYLLVFRIFLKKKRISFSDESY